MRQVTQADIAKELGLSPQAVGYAMGGHRNSRTRLRAETRQRILETAEQLGYRPHRYAQVVRRGKSGVISLVQFSGLLQAGIERGMHAAAAVHDAGYRLHAADLLWYRNGFSAIRDAILEARSEGVILCNPTAALPMAELQRVFDAHIPVASIAGVRLPGVPMVRADAEQGLYELTRHVLGLEYRRLALLVSAKARTGNEFEDWPTLERVAGFRKAITAAGLDSGVGRIVYQTDPHDPLSPYEVGYRGMRQMLQGDEMPEVVLCTNDDWAIGALRACAEAGVRVPDDVALTGFDNTVAGQYAAAPLTTVAQRPKAMAETAVKVLLEMIGGQSPTAENMIIKTPCQIVVRQSCGAQQKETVR